MEMTEGEKKWYKTGIQVGIEALLNRRWVFVEAYTRRGIKSKEDFINNFKVQLNSLKNSEGEYLNPDLSQIESQLAVDKVKIEKENDIIKKEGFQFQ